MRRPNTSLTALIVSVVALFAVLGGTSVAASLLIGTNQIKNNAVTTSKLANHSVTTSRPADNSVTSSKVADGSLKGSDVAPNTLLAASGTATNSDKLGNRPSGDFMLGRGQMFVNRVQVPANSSSLIVSFAFGGLIGKCARVACPRSSTSRTSTRSTSLTG